MTRKKTWNRIDLPVYVAAYKNLRHGAQLTLDILRKKNPVLM
jgi:hypothetical protein